MNRQRRQIIDHPSLRKKGKWSWGGKKENERKEERERDKSKSGSRKITIGENNNNENEPDSVIRVVATTVGCSHSLSFDGAQNGAGESGDKKEVHHLGHL